MNSKDFEMVQQLKKKDERGNVYYTIEDLYNLYDNYKVCTLVKILKDGSSIKFFKETEEDIETKETEVSV